MEHISANSEITIVEGVELGPTLGAELSAAEDERMEHDQAEDDRLELVVLVRLRFIVVSLVELADSATQVSLQILRSLVRNLDGVLEDGLGNDFLVGQTWGLRRDEASEVDVAIMLDGLLESALELLHPVSHQMDVLDHEPVTLLGGFLEGVHGDLLLTLTHGNVCEGLFVGSLAVLGADALHIWRGVHTGEEHEESGGLHSHLVVHDLHIEGWLLDVLNAKRLQDVLSEGTLETVRSEGSQKQDSVEESNVLEALGELSGLGLLVAVPLLPLKGLGLHRLSQVLEDLDGLETDDCGPDSLGDEFAEVVGDLGRVKSDLFLDEGVDFVLLDQVLAYVDTQAEHGCED
mmetsp:Transcript_7954/g.9556  ORF Transcript_7954/g.9556 Transcript_7954/m.9556 type:complete len:347 (-) Transcript_7954:1418-2458(-)